jgi:CrcB protein
MFGKSILRIREAMVNMEGLINVFFVGVGGMLGSASRYLLTLLPIKVENSFPVITFAINITGAFCIGLIIALTGKHVNVPPRLVLFLKVGLCGGFTTFSTFSAEALQLIQSGKYLVAFLYMVLSVALCVAAAAVAQVIVN